MGTRFLAFHEHNVTCRAASFLLVPREVVAESSEVRFGDRRHLQSWAKAYLSCGEWCVLSRYARRGM